MCNRGGHKREKCVHEYSVMCIFHQCHSVTVSQCRRGGAGGLQSTAGQGTSAYCRLRGVYSKKSTVKSTVGQGGSKGSTVEKSTVVSGIPFTVDCRL